MPSPPGAVLAEADVGALCTVQVGARQVHWKQKQGVTLAATAARYRQHCPTSRHYHNNNLTFANKHELQSKRILPTSIHYADPTNVTTDSQDRYTHVTSLANLAMNQLFVGLCIIKFNTIRGMEINCGLKV